MLFRTAIGSSARRTISTKTCHYGSNPWSTGSVLSEHAIRCLLGTRFTRQREEAHRVGLFVFIVDGADEHVVGDVVEVASVLEPWTGHGDVISCALALGLDQHLYNAILL
jgi:hypothetical protein